MATLAPPQVATPEPFQMRSLIVPLSATVMGAFMVVLDSTSLNVTIPTLAREFGADLATLQWVVTAYMLASAAVIPLTGWLGDRFGARRVFLTVVGLFTIGSLLCALAPNAEALVFFRVLQGLGGGCVMPMSLVFAYRLAPPEYRGRVMASLGLPVVFAPAIGPTLGGYLVEYADWRWIFLINIPVGIVAIAIGLRSLPNLPRQVSAALDLPGMLLAPIAFVALAYGVNQGATSWTALSTILPLAVGIAALLAFIAVELRSETPLLDLRVFQSSEFSRTIATQWVSMIGMGGGMFLTPLFLQQVLGYGAFETGLVMLSQALTSIVFMQIGGRVYDKIGVRPLAVLGLAIVSVSTFWLSRITSTTSGIDLIAPLALRGVGTGLMMMPLGTHAMSVAPRELIGRVTSLQTSLQNVVQSFAIAGLVTYLTSRIAANIATITPSTSAQHDALAASFSDGFTALAVITALGIGLAISIGRSERAPQPTMAVETA